MGEKEYFELISKDPRAASLLFIEKDVALRERDREIEKLRQRVAELERERVDCGKLGLDLCEQFKQLTAERDALKQQRDELLAAAEAIEIDAEECLDFDECTAMLVPIDTYHKLMEALASVKGGAA